MSGPADGLLAAVTIDMQPPRPIPDWASHETCVRAVAAWLAHHLDALAETGEVDHGSFRLAAAEIRAAGGVS